MARFTKDLLPRNAIRRASDKRLVVFSVLLFLLSSALLGWICSDDLPRLPFNILLHGTPDGD